MTFEMSIDLITKHFDRVASASAVKSLSNVNYIASSFNFKNLTNYLIIKYVLTCCIILGKDY